MSDFEAEKRKEETKCIVIFEVIFI